MKKYGIIIKTNDYAGNFERELCAHCTGQVGECGVGSNYVEPQIAAKFESIIDQVPDDNGTYRPVSISSENSNDVVIHLSGKPTEEQVQIVKDRAYTFTEVNKTKTEWPTPVEILGFKLAEFGVTQEATEI